MRRRSRRSWEAAATAAGERALVLYCVKAGRDGGPFVSPPGTGKLVGGADGETDPLRDGM